MPRDIFVSYSQPDRDCAYEASAHLESQGMSVWIAPRDVSPAADWAEEIIDALSQARIMVLVFSSSSNASAQVRREVERAVHKGLRILPFRIEEVLPSKSLEYFLSAQHWLDAFPPPRAPHYARLCAHVGALLESARGTIPSAAQAASPDWSGAAALAPALVGIELAALERELARHIGPIARLLIQRASRRARDFADLTQQLAGELEDESARRGFIVACAQLRGHH